MPCDLPLISIYVAVVLYNYLITYIQLENNHGSGCGRWCPRRRCLLLDASPVPQQRKEKFTQTHGETVSHRIVSL